MSANATKGTQVVTGELHRVRRGHGKGFSPEPPAQPSRGPARVAVTLTLAHMIRQAIDRGEIRDQAEAARMLGLSRARVTQLIDLTFLAPDLQEAILFRNVGHPTRLRARWARDAAQELDWVRQRTCAS